MAATALWVAWREYNEMLDRLTAEHTSCVVNVFVTAELSVTPYTAAGTAAPSQSCADTVPLTLVPCRLTYDTTCRRYARRRRRRDETVLSRRWCEHEFATSLR